MKLALSLLALAAMGFVAESAEACTPRPPTFFIFAPNSSEIPQDRIGALRDLTQPMRSLPGKCSSYEVRAFVDPTENGDQIVARMDAIKRYLMQEGALEALISARIERSPMAPSRGNPYQRAVTVLWNMAPGKWRCDPASHNPGWNSSACQSPYTRCYMELADGTICDHHKVPNPNAETYSVIQ